MQSSTRILVLEPYEMLAHLIADLITLNGYSIRVAISIREAERLALHFKPQLFIIEPHLCQKINGVDFAKMILDTYPKSRIIFITSSKERIEKLAPEFTQIISKPFTSVALFEAITEVERTIN